MKSVIKVPESEVGSVGLYKCKDIYNRSIIVRNKSIIVLGKIEKVNNYTRLVGIVVNAGEYNTLIGEAITANTWERLPVGYKLELIQE